LQTVVWTVDHPSWFGRACALGLRAVITNDPASMCAARDEFLAHSDTCDEATEDLNAATRDPLPA
jgi:hypothetical protein